jgi:amidase
MDDEILTGVADRSPGRPPVPDENPLNAWAWRCSIKGADSGPLSGKTVSVKDVIPVAGMPFTNGSALLRGNIAPFDATAVTRILEAGGEITGIATTENLSFSALSVSAVQGHVLNAHDHRRSAGGSSSGVAALVASGACDVGMGGDQGGSIRIPASLNGVFGLKPTFGLVPYTGCAPIDSSLDHIGPIGRTTRDVASLLDAVAGADGRLDPRQTDVRVPADGYVAALAEGVEGLRIGVLREGYEWPDMSEPDVDETVRDVVSRLAGLGVTVTEVSLPSHRKTPAIFTPMLLEGAAEFMINGYGIGTGWKGLYNTGYAENLARAIALQSHLLFPTHYYALLVGGYLRESYGGRYYAKAQNLAIKMRDAYDALFEDCDVLLTPTMPIKAPVRPEAGASPAEMVKSALDGRVLVNTCAFNMTNHPALTVPVGPSEGLPVGVQLVAKIGHDEVLLRLGQAMEDAGMTLRQLVEPELATA